MLEGGGTASNNVFSAISDMMTGVYEVFTIGFGDDYDIQYSSDLSEDIKIAFDRCRTKYGSIEFNTILILLAPTAASSNTITIPSDLNFHQLIVWTLEPYMHTVEFYTDESILLSRHPNSS